jgi:hypothetical protein
MAKGKVIRSPERTSRSVQPSRREVLREAMPMLVRMFEKRLRGYRAIGYARGQAPLGFGEAPAERVLEYDEEVLRARDIADDFT